MIDPGEIDFAWYLAVWLTQFGQTEESFWHRQNPVRMIALLKALHPPKKEEPPSLAAYLGGG